MAKCLFFLDFIIWLNKNQLAPSLVAQLQPGTFMTLTRTGGRQARHSGCLVTAIATMLMATAMASPAAALSTKQAMAQCKARYGLGVTSVTIKKNGHIVCREGPGPNATRQEVYDYCKKRSGATMVQIRKLSKGKWQCLHNGHF